MRAQRPSPAGIRAPRQRVGQGCCKGTEATGLKKSQGAAQAGNQPNSRSGCKSVQVLQGSIGPPARCAGVSARTGWNLLGACGVVRRGPGPSGRRDRLYHRSCRHLRSSAGGGLRAAIRVLSLGETRSPSSQYPVPAGDVWMLGARAPPGDSARRLACWPSSPCRPVRP